MKKAGMISRTLLLSAALSGLLLTGRTRAYLSDYAAADNPVTIGYNETRISEEFPDSPPVSVKENPVITKKVRIASPDPSGANVDCYVRAYVLYSNSDIGKAVTLGGMDTTSWTKGSDGYYYYKPVLKAGAQTTPLFSSVAIDSSRLDADDLAHVEDFRISVYEESVQANGSSGYQEAWKSFLTHAGG